MIPQPPSFTGTSTLFPYTTLFQSEDIRAEIFAQTGLTASAGISYNKFLAKLGSGYNKPNGQTVIRPGRGAEIVAELDASRFHGIGPATAAKMAELGIKTGPDLRKDRKSTRLNSSH